MELLPNEILEHIGTYLAVPSLSRLRISTTWLYWALKRLHDIRMKFTRWKITAHLIFDKHHQTFDIHQAWVSLGEFRGSDNVMYRHEDCIDCYDQYWVPTENDDPGIPDEYITYHGDKYLQSQQIYTVVRKGVGNRGLEQIIRNTYNNRVNITIGWNPSLLNVVNNNIFVLIGNVTSTSSIISQTKQTEAELCLGIPRPITPTMTDDITYGLMGSLCWDWPVLPHDWDEDQDWDEDHD